MIIKNCTWQKRPTHPVVDGQPMRRVISPTENQVVYTVKRDQNGSPEYLYPVLIISGQYEVNGRISNTWSWYKVNDDLTVGEKESGYGEFYQSPIEFKVSVRKIFNISKRID